MVYGLYNHELGIGKYLGHFLVNVEFESRVRCLRPRNPVIFQVEIRGHATDRGELTGVERDESDAGGARC